MMAMMMMMIIIIIIIIYERVCKVFCPEAGPSLDMYYQGRTYLSLLDKRKE